MEERVAAEQGVNLENGIQGQERGTKAVEEVKRNVMQAEATVEVGASRRNHEKGIHAM